ncbi:MAG: sensor signal transduction histidine kinase [Flaviaesturariibacter sp.]|nr:sensor signal transduction histidine kinase [Flaviaesturariibacter sp.]
MDVRSSSKEPAESPSANQYYDLFLQAPVGIVILKGANFYVELANQYYLEIIGKTEAQFTGKYLFDAVPELVGQGIEQLLNRVLEGETLHFNEFKVDLIRKGKPTSIYVNFTYKPLQDSDGYVEGVMVVVVEVTEQVESRLRVEASEERTRLAIEAGNLGLFEVNLLNNQLVTTSKFDSLFGFSEPVQREDYIETIHPQDRAIRDKAYNEMIALGRLEYESRAVWKDGSLYWLRIVGTVIYDGTMPVKVIGVAQDISEQKSFAEALENKVRERTIELQRSNSELEQFAYATSHDLQEPLRKVQVFINILLEKHGSELSEKAKTYVNKVMDAAKRMSGLIKDLLEYSRISKGGSHFRETNLREIVHQVKTDYELMIDQKQAIIEAEDLPVIEAMPLQMNQLFYNLIGNSLRYAKKNVPPIIKISSAALSPLEREMRPQLLQNKSYVRITVEDNGIGFEQEYAEKIFGIFQSLNERSQYGSYGIGLALCRKIVDNHQGIIYAQGKVREGATFTIILPLNQD